MPHDWKIYRTRFLVRARQLTQPVAFIDAHGREHNGRAGDYLVESSDGPRISAREIFEDVYVALESAESTASRSLSQPATPLAAGEPGFSCAANGAHRIVDLAPIQPAAEQVNLPV